MEKREIIPRNVIVFVDNMKKYGNMFGIKKSKIPIWFEDLPVNEESGKLFFASCMGVLASYGEIFIKLMEAPEEVGINYENLEKITISRYCDSLKKAYLLLNKLGIQCSHLGLEEPCCGIIYHTYGFIKEFREHASKVYKLLKERGIEEIITPNPICAYAFKYLYPQCIENYEIKARTIVEVINNKLDFLRGNYKEKITIHDPCYLARYLGITKELRTILGKIDGLELIESNNSKKLTRCCGGGGVEIVDPKLSMLIATRRVKELTDTGANEIITLCPICMMMLRIGAWKLKLKTNILELHEIIYDSIK